MNKIQNKVMPVANKIAQQRHLRAISTGLMYIVPFSLLAAVFNIIATPPITESIIQEGGWYAALFGGWYEFSQKYSAVLSLPSNMTLGLISVIAVFGIAYSLAKSYKMKELSTAFTALIMFLIVASPVEPAYLASAAAGAEDLSELSTTNVLSTSYLGSSGLFVAIVIALLSVELTRFCFAKDLRIKMPDSVPPAVAESFSTIVPVMINCGVFYGGDLLLRHFADKSLPEIIMMVLTPAIDNVNTPWAMIGIITLGNFLWLFGIHGAAVTSMLYLPVQMAVIAENAAIVAQGGEAVYQPVMITAFNNSYFGLVLLMLIIAKSRQLKAVGKVSVVPGVFMISEPVIFGAPIMFNPILAVPHLLAPVISMVLTWVGYVSGFLDPSYNMIMARLPLGLNPFFSAMSIKNFLFFFVMLAVQTAIWYPFFKIYDNQLVLQESQNSKEQTAQE